MCVLWAGWVRLIKVDKSYKKPGVVVTYTFAGKQLLKQARISDWGK